ncbi:hypothetical protein E7Y31_20890 [Candidatus Frankia alpina]|uniref:Uncharacterized protein n=1 Tax=Candidatus Frankia alpina TaxID=2699483 RepID=A0A4S5BYL0_9ACTN|nr:hypothetical protein E7Y31_20890 [Candidatus Frankia alpina]
MTAVRNTKLPLSPTDSGGSQRSAVSASASATTTLAAASGRSTPRRRPITQKNTPHPTLSATTAVAAGWPAYQCQMTR